MIYGKSLDYLKSFRGSGKTQWNEAKIIMSMKHESYWWTKRLVPVPMLKDTLNGFPMFNHLRQYQRLQKQSFLLEHFKCSKLEVKYEEYKEVLSPPHTIV